MTWCRPSGDEAPRPPNGYSSFCGETRSSLCDALHSSSSRLSQGGDDEPRPPGAARALRLPHHAAAASRARDAALRSHLLADRARGRLSAGGGPQGGPQGGPRGGGSDDLDRAMACGAHAHTSRSASLRCTISGTCAAGKGMSCLPHGKASPLSLLSSLSTALPLRASKRVTVPPARTDLARSSAPSSTRAAAPSATPPCRPCSPRTHRRRRCSSRRRRARHPYVSSMRPSRCARRSRHVSRDGMRVMSCHM